MNEITISLLSGLIGAFIGSILTIIFTLWRDSQDTKRRIAKEKLEKVYGPLVALKKKIDLVNQSTGGFISASKPSEKEMLENIIFHQYHLVDDDLKEGLVLLHPDISRHTHNVVKREISLTQEVLVIRKGKLKVNFYDSKQNYLESRILKEGDVMLLASGGHGFKVIEDVEMIEVKQGPYLGEKDKTKFKGIEK